MVFKPVQMAMIAILGLRKNRQSAISILHDLDVIQLEPLSKDVYTLLRNERDEEFSLPRFLASSHHQAFLPF